MENKKAIVVGGGVSGLSAAWELKNKGFEVTVIERRDAAGGVIQTFESGGFRAESGTNSVMVTSPRLLKFFEDAGLGEKVERSKPAAKKRFFVRRGKPRAVPMGPLSLLFTRLFSFLGKLRLFMEPFVGRSNPDSEPSVEEFSERRLGKDVSDYAINPFMAGVYGGDPKRLSIKYAFPAFWNFEQKYGSIICGAIKSMKEKKAAGNIFKPVMISFEGGMGTLIKKLSEDIGDGLKTSARLISIDSTADGRWEVSWGTNTEDCCDTYDALVIAVPAPDLKSLPVGGALAAALEPLSKIVYAPVATYSMGYKRQDVSHKLDGFGALIPQREDFSILGSLFVSSIFCGRAPEGFVTLTNYVGGMRHPELAALPQEEMRKVVLRDVRKLLGVKSEPVFEKMFYWEHAIPQYNIGYGDIIESASEAEKHFNSLALIGSYRGGVGVGACIENALKAADSVAEKCK